MQIEKSEKLVWMTLYFKVKDHSAIKVLEFKEICSIAIKKKQWFWKRYKDYCNLLRVPIAMFMEKNT